MAEVADSFKIDRQVRNPWISDKTLYLVDERKKIYNKKSQEYIELNKAIKKSAKLDKNIWIEKRCKEIDNNFNDGKVREAYKLIKQLKGGFRTKLRAVKDTNDKLLSEDKQITERWAEYLEELYTDKNTYGEGILEEMEKNQQKTKRKTGTMES